MQKTRGWRWWRIVTTIVVAAVVLLALLLVGVRLIGFKVYTIVSGSMAPQYPVGSLIYVREISPYDIQVGDVITFSLHNGITATHRVIAVDAENQQVYTKGDANDTADSPVAFSNIIGKPVCHIPALGYVAFYIQHPPGRYITIAIGACLLLLVILPDLFKKDKPTDSSISPTDGEQTTG